MDETVKTSTSERSKFRRVPTYHCREIQSWDHDPKAWTEGLAYNDGDLYVSIGDRKQSLIRRISLRSGTLITRPLEEGYYGEGLTIVGNKVLQLTESHEIGFIYSLEKLEPLGNFEYKGTGWGLSYDGHFLIVTDGSHQLQFLDPISYEIRYVKPATDENNMPVKDLDEIEYIRGKIFANIHGDYRRPNRIAVLDGNSGDLRCWIDLARVVPADADEASGIAYDEAGDRLFVTGKYWPKIYQIKLLLNEEEQTIDSIG